MLLPGSSAQRLRSADAWLLNATTAEWARLSMGDLVPAGRRQHAAAALSPHELLVVGGLGEAGAPLGDSWVLGLPHGGGDHSGASWSRTGLDADAEWPLARVGHTLTALGSRLLVLGGREYSTNHFDPSLHSFNVTSRQWTEVPLEKAGGGRTPVRTGHCATVHAGRILLFGGLNDRNLLLDDLMSVSLIE